MLVHQIVAGPRHVPQAASHLRVEPDDVDSLSKGIRPPDAVREEKFHYRAEDGFFVFGPGDRLERDLPAFEKLDQANALDIFRRKPFVGLRTDELERPQVEQAPDGLPRRGAQILSR